MQKFLVLFILGISLIGCGKTNKYWEAEKFSLTPGALENNAEVTLIYHCREPYVADELFYRYSLVISKNTNDTINVLTFPDPVLPEITKGDGTLTYNDQPILLELLGENGNDIYGLDTPKPTWLKLLKVARDPKFDHIADNSFPTVIGSLINKKYKWKQ